MRPPAVILGDWNLSAEVLEDLADQVGAEFVRGHGVDHALLLGGVRLESVRRNLPRYPSDHGPLLLEVSVDGWRVRILWWNVYVGAQPAAVLRAVSELADAHQPDLIALGEAKRCRDVLAHLPGYRRRQGYRGEARNMAVLVRRNVRVTRFGWLRMRQPWIGPRHDLHHGPRAYPRLRVAERETRGAVLRVLAVHLPTGGYQGRNVEAVRESVARILRWGKP